MGDLLTNLGIDWRLLIAQIVNFLILFFLLKRLLYRPVLKILEERRARIAKGLKDAEAAEIRLKDVALERQAILNRAEAERRSLLEAAAEEAERIRKQRLAGAVREYEAIIERAKLEAEQSRDELMAEVRREAGDLVLAVSRKVTQGKLPQTIHDELLASALEELKGEKL